MKTVGFIWAGATIQIWYRFRWPTNFARETPSMMNPPSYDELFFFVINVVSIARFHCILFRMDTVGRESAFCWQTSLQFLMHPQTQYFFLRLPPQHIIQVAAILLFFYSYAPNHRDWNCQCLFKIPQYCDTVESRLNMENSNSCSHWGVPIGPNHPRISYTTAFTGLLLMVWMGDMKIKCRRNS